MENKEAVKFEKPFAVDRPIRRNLSFRMNTNGWTHQIKNIVEHLLASVRQIEMSGRNLKSFGERAHRFAALGDETRLSIVDELSRHQRQSITELTRTTSLTRQAMTKHLRVLEKAKIVRSIRDGRENLFELEAKTCSDLQDYLKTINQQWNDALAGLKDFVE